MNQKIVKEEIYLWWAYLFERWIRIFRWGPDGGMEVEVLGMGSLILILPTNLLRVFLAFFWGVIRLAVAFCLPTWDFKELALTSTEGSLIGSLPGGQTETWTTEIRMSPLKPGTREIKLSKACIQTKET
jgi:hypothetical protein